jgi:D-alanine--poly(phosphoribitol) ligase subunit 1
MQTSVLEFFENGAIVHSPEKTAVIDAEMCVTFKELEEHSKKCAAHLLKVLPDLCLTIAVYLPKSIDTITANLGIAYSGRVYTNLDIQSPPQRIRNILDHLGIQYIYTSRSHALKLEGCGVSPNQMLFVEDALCAELTDDDSAAISRCQERLIDTDPFCIINTSGSTGTPKGVTISHRGVIDFMEWVTEALKLDGNEVIGSLSPFHFDIYLMELQLCLFKGATMVIIQEQLPMFPAKILELMITRSVNFIFWVPTIMVNIANLDLLSKFDLKGLKRVLFAGEVFPMKQLNLWRKQLPECQFVNLYGPIEITVDCTYYLLDREFSDDDALPIGYPCRNTDVLILNDSDRPSEADEQGELCVRGSSLALGYWNDEERTSEAFVQNPLNTRYPELIYRTGDLVYRNEEGLIYFVGRKDFQIKHLGYRIDLGEIENVSISLSGVDNACALYGEATKRMILVYESAIQLSSEELQKQLLAVLPRYMVPKEFQRIDAIPMNPNGKIDRQKLKEIYIGGT